MRLHIKWLILPVLSAIVPTVLAATSPTLAIDAGPDCTKGFQHDGRVVGTNISIADVPTYYSAPAPSTLPKKVLLFFADIYSPFYVNNQLLQDYFASKGAYPFSRASS